MKLIAELENEKHEISLKQSGEKISAEVNGRVYEIEASEVEPNVYLFKHANKIYQIFVAPNENSNEPMQVNVNGSDFEIKLTDPKRLRGTTGTNEHGDGAAEIKTAMPGKIVRILVEQGAEVQKGDGILVVEAMKMQNEMKSPKDGIVTELRAAEGATVNAGDILAVIK